MVANKAVIPSIQTLGILVVTFATQLHSSLFKKGRQGAKGDTVNRMHRQFLDMTIKRK